jgi:hypothetical protein
VYSDWSTAETFGEYSKLPLPADYYSRETVNEFPKTSEIIYYFEGNDMWVKTDYKGQLKLLYLAFPTPIVTLADVITLKDQIADTTLVYGLLAELLATENENVASFYNQKYEESKVQNRPKTQARFVKIKDVYNTRW